MEVVWLAVAGLVAGVCGGLLGIGGSIVMIPAMTEILGPRQHVYQAAALVVNFFVAVPAVVQHVRAGAVRASLLVPLIPAAVVAAVGGVLCSELPVFAGERSIYLTALFGVFLFYVAGREVAMLWRPKIVDADGASAEGGVIPSPSRWRVALWVGLPTGFISGFLGVGGGIVAVPLLRRRIGIDLRTAIASSATTIIALSLVGAFTKHLALFVNHPDVALTAPLRLAVWLIPTAIIGSFVGGRLTHVLPLRTVHMAFTVLLLVAGGRMVMRAL